MTLAHGRQPLGQKTSEAGGEDNAEKSYAERIDGMAEKTPRCCMQPRSRRHEAQSDQQKIAAADQARVADRPVANGGLCRKHDDAHTTMVDRRMTRKGADGDEVAVPTRSRIDALALSPLPEGEVDVARWVKRS